MGEQAWHAEPAQQAPLPAQQAFAPPSQEAAAPQPHADETQPLHGDSPGSGAKYPSPLPIGMDQLQGAAHSPLNANIFDDDDEHVSRAAAPGRDTSNGPHMGEPAKNGAVGDMLDPSAPLSME